MQKHPSDEELIQHYLRRAEGEAEARTAAHLENGCATCERASEELRTIAAFFSAPGLTETPSLVLGRALAWLEQRESSRTSKEQAGSVAKGNVGSAARRAASIAANVRRRLADATAGADRVLGEILATLVFDTAAGALLPGIRGTATASGRQLLYESEAGELHLQIDRGAHGKLEVYGQFLPRKAEPSPSEGRAIILTQQGKESVRRLSPTGEFRFSGLASEEFGLRIEWDGARIRIDALPPSQERNG